MSIAFLAKALTKVWSIAVRSEAPALNSIEKLWPAFRSQYTKDFEKWYALPAKERARDIPHIDLEEGIRAKDVPNVKDNLGDIPIPKQTKDFLKTTGTEIWSSTTFDPLIDKFKVDAVQRAYLVAHLFKAHAVYLRPNSLGNKNPVLFMAYRTLDDAVSHISNATHHLSSLTHEAGHLIDDYLGKASSTPEFIRAFNADIKLLASNKPKDLLEHARLSGGFAEEQLRNFPTETLMTVRDLSTKFMSHFLPAPYSKHRMELARSEAFAETWSMLSTPKNNSHDDAFKAIYPATTKFMEGVFKQFNREVTAIQKAVIEAQPKPTVAVTGYSP